MQSDSDGSLSPEPKPLLQSEKESSLKVLQPSDQINVSRNDKDVASKAKEDISNRSQPTNGATFALTGAQTGESETDVVESNQSKRTSKINMLAESVFGVSTKQAVAEAEANVSPLFITV